MAKQDSLDAQTRDLVRFAAHWEMENLWVQHLCHDFGEDQLPAHYGNALEWKYLYGYSVEEIAAKLGVGLEAAQSLLARAKRAFQEVYGTLTDDLVGGATKGGQSVADPT